MKYIYTYKYLQSPSAQQVSAYCYIIQKIGVLLKLGYNVFDQLEHILKTLHVRLLDTKQLEKFAAKEIFIGKCQLLST